MIPLGRGFFEFSFSSAEDLRTVWSVGTWNLQPGTLRLSQWVPDFNPAKQKSTHSQCWIRFHELPLEYWRPRILFEIASGLGTPISLDENSRLKTFGHFARVLIDIDLSGQLHDSIMVERDGFAFFIGIEYEKLPFFCSHCQAIGHSLSHCRQSNPPGALLNGGSSSKNLHERIEPIKSKSVYVPKAIKIVDNGIVRKDNEDTGVDFVPNSVEFHPDEVLDASLPSSPHPVLQERTPEEIAILKENAALQDNSRDFECHDTPVSPSILSVASDDVVPDSVPSTVVSSP